MLSLTLLLSVFRFIFSVLFSIVIIKLGEKSAALNALRAFVRASMRYVLSFSRRSRV